MCTDERYELQVQSTGAEFPDGGVAVGRFKVCAALFVSGGDVPGAAAFVCDQRFCKWGGAGGIGSSDIANERSVEKNGV